jgi:MFS family permease
LRIVELLCAIVTAVIALGLGFYFSRLWAPTAGWSLLIGVVCGVVCAIGYFGGTVLLGEFVPDLLDPNKVGYWFMMLVFGAPVIGALGGFMGYRRTPEFPPD